MSAATLEPVAEREFEAISKVNDDGIPHVGTCILVLGDGTQRVHFKNGRAKVPASLAPMVATHPHIDLLGYEGAKPSSRRQVAAEAAPAVEDKDARIRELEAALAVRDAEAQQLLQTQAAGKGPDREGVELAADGVERAVEIEGDGRDGEELSEEVRLAMEHLAEEGEEVPEPAVAKDEAPALRPGFEAETPDGQARCRAAKGDGSQCANPAGEGGACQIAKHKEQLVS